MSSKRRKMSLNKVTSQRGTVGQSASASAKTAIIRRLTTSKAPLRDELLCGIPNEVTLDHIAALLPWRECQVLSTISPDWQRAFQGRMVYDVRVRSRSTETFFVVLSRICTARGDKNVDAFGLTRSIKFERKSTLSLFSLRKERWYTLPPLPGCDLGMPSDCRHVLVDGSMYLLGVNRSGEKDTFSGKVYVLDLAGHLLEWRRCADMQVPRRGYAIGVVLGKIFVFNGASEGTSFEVRNEKYDPKVDAWSWIAPTIPGVTLTGVYSVGQEFFVCKGWMPYAPPSRWGPFCDDEAGMNRPATKLMVIIGAGGPKSIRTSDDDAEDDMDGLHAIIENRLIDCVKSRTLEPSPAKSLLAGDIKSHENSVRTGRSFFGRSFLWAYDPVKDEWRDFENEIVGTQRVDIVQPKYDLELGRSPHSWAVAWEVSL